MRPIAVVGAVILRDGEVLCARRGPAGEMAGLWEFPGGKVEPGEGPRAALEREIREELLCDVHVGNEVATTSHGPITLTTYVCALLAGEPQPTEHAELRWVRLADVPGLDWAPADIPAALAVASFGTTNR